MFLTMPGHDHSLRQLFEPKGLATETMLLNWICPVKKGESSPWTVIGWLFVKYQEILWQQGWEMEYLSTGYSQPLFADIKWPLLGSYLKWLHL